MRIRSQVASTKTDAPLNVPSVLGSAAMLTRRQLGLVARATTAGGWQAEAWTHYRTVPELRFGVNWRAAATSRCPFIIARRDDGSETPTPIGHAVAEDLLAQLFAHTGRPNAVNRMVIQLDVAGETYLVGLDKEVPAAGNVDPDAIGQLSATRWIVVGRSEFGGTEQAPTVKLPETGAEVLLGEGYSTVIRLWWQDPELAWQATSTTQNLAVPLREINTISRSISAAGRSRLSGPGMVAIAETVYGQRSPADSNEPDPFVRELAEAMTAAIGDEDSPAAHVPICFAAPDQLIGKVFEHIKFSDQYDPKAVEQRDAAIKRVATGLDMPGEMITGMGESNHWSSWQIDESAIRIHISPMLELLADAITHQYLQPALRLLGIDNPTLCVWYDAAPVTSRPNLGPDSLQARDRDVVGDATVRREFGWGDEDAPTEEEQQQRLLMRLMEIAPELRPAILPVLLSAVGITAPQVVQVADQPALPATPTNPEPADPESRGIPETEGNPSVAGSAAVVVTAAEAAVLRALELVNKRLVTREQRGRTTGKPAWMWHTEIPRRPGGYDWARLMAGALDMLPEVLHCPACAPCVTATVDRYVRGLVESGVPHADQREHLVAALRTAGCLDG